MTGSDGDSDRGPGAPRGNDNAVGNSGGPGAPEGNDRARGNDGGAPPEGNKNAASHYIYAVERNPGETLEWLEEHDPEAYEWICDKAEGYLEDVSFTQESPKYDQLLQVCVSEYSIWKATGIQVREGLVKKTHKRAPSGELVPVEAEHPVNKPLDRLERQVTQRLDALGIYDRTSGTSSGPLSNEYYTVVDQNGNEIESFDGSGDASVTD